MLFAVPPLEGRVKLELDESLDCGISVSTLSFFETCSLSSFAILTVFEITVDDLLALWENMHVRRGHCWPCGQGTLANSPSVVNMVGKSEESCFKHVLEVLENRLMGLISQSSPDNVHEVIEQA